MKENKDSNIKEDVGNHIEGRSTGNDILASKLFKFKKTSSNKRKFGEKIGIEPIN